TCTTRVRSHVFILSPPFINYNLLDTDGFATCIALFTGFGNGKSLFPLAKGGRGLRLKHCNAEALPICFYQGIPFP
ncbi:MAG TPA: hypothetical protein VNQ74_05845, partial [Burkholderiaceae bacterium]|nr:hypothetical protein [Burkholderiaceae bacterium]